MTQSQRFHSTQRRESVGGVSLGRFEGGGPQEKVEILNPYLCILKHFCVYF